MGNELAEGSRKDWTTRFPRVTTLTAREHSISHCQSSHCAHAIRVVHLNLSGTGGHRRGCREPDAAQRGAIPGQDLSLRQRYGESSWHLESR